MINPISTASGFKCLEGGVMSKSKCPYCGTEYIHAIDHPCFQEKTPAPTPRGRLAAMPANRPKPKQASFKQCGCLERLSKPSTMGDRRKSLLQKLDKINK